MRRTRPMSESLSVRLLQDNAGPPRRREPVPDSNAIFEDEQRGTSTGRSGRRTGDSGERSVGDEKYLTHMDRAPAPLERAYRCGLGPPPGPGRSAPAAVSGNEQTIKSMTAPAFFTQAQASAGNCGDVIGVPRAPSVAGSSTFVSWTASPAPTPGAALRRR